MQNVFMLPALLHLPFFLLSLVAAFDSVDESLLWGPYRPNLYFGMRPRIPRSLSFGIMWTSVVDDKLDLKRLRHTCEQSDRMTQYGWSIYDVRNGGTQSISDAGNNINLTLQLVKIPDGSMKGSWGLRVDGRFRDASSPSGADIIWYMTIEESALSGLNALSCQERFSSEIHCQGTASGLGSFDIQLPPGKIGNTTKSDLHVLKVPDEELWKAKGELRQLLERVGAF
jgi:mannosyl-oligosaccharide glucosidase